MNNIIRVHVRDIKIGDVIVAVKRNPKIKQIVTDIEIDEDGYCFTVKDNFYANRYPQYFTHKSHVYLFKNEAGE